MAIRNLLRLAYGDGRKAAAREAGVAGAVGSAGHILAMLEPAD